VCGGKWGPLQLPRVRTIESDRAYIANQILKAGQCVEYPNQMPRLQSRVLGGATLHSTEVEHILDRCIVPSSPRLKEKSVGYRQQPIPAMDCILKGIEGYRISADYNQWCPPWPMGKPTGWRLIQQVRHVLSDAGRSSADLESANPPFLSAILSK